MARNGAPYVVGGRIREMLQLDGAADCRRGSHRSHAENELDEREGNTLKWCSIRRTRALLRFVRTF